MANWERDADCLLDLHRRVGIDSFKIDSVKTTDLAAEKNLWRFFEKILRESAGKVVFDLDVTAEIRPGYLGATGVGPVFVENRYTDFGSYWPHHTLRNLWRLSQYIDPVRLRMEFLNNTRRTEVYGADPLAPGKWKADTLFAITLVASPLGFFEVSKLPESYITAVAPLVATWKRERARMQGGRTLPIGEAPDGLSWTGFSTVCDGGGSAYVLLFRELNAAGRHSVALPGFAPDKAAVTVLGGRGSASYGSSRLEVSIPETLDFLWVRLDAPAR
jgi:alpha-galactosidase